MDKEPKKVLHVVYAMNTGGVESWLMSIYRQLDREKIQFDFLVNTQEKAFFDDEIRQLGGNIIYAGALNNPLKIYRSAKKILNDSEYVAVHCHNVENATPVLIAARLNGITVRIYQSHNDLNNELLHLSLLKKMYLKASRLIALKYTNQLLAVSKSAGDSLFMGRDYRLLSLGLDIEKFSPEIKKKASRNDFGLNEDDFVIGHVGRFDIQKNHLFLLKIAKKLIQFNSKTKFLLVGNGKLKEEIKDKVKKNGLDKFFIFAGLRDDVPQIMSQVMDVFVFPSRHEGLGLVVVEAQAAGLSVVCSDVVPQEAVVNEELVKKVSLSMPAQKWAKEIVSTYEQNKTYDKNKAYKKIEGSSFNLNNTIKIWEKIWQKKNNI